MIYKLVCAGDNHFNKLYVKDNNEIIVAIDGGYKVLYENHIKVDYFFGDFDSLDNDNINCNKKYKYPKIKDKGDFELAIDFIINDLNVSINDTIIIYNATGGRLDHYYAILNIVKKYFEYNIYLVDLNNKIYIKNKEFNIKKDGYKYVSFFSMNDDTIISIKGCKYNLENYNLKINDNLCLSNEITDQCLIKVNKDILVIESK